MMVFMPKSILLFYCVKNFFTKFRFRKKFFAVMNFMRFRTFSTLILIFLTIVFLLLRIAEENISNNSHRFLLLVSYFGHGSS